MFKSQIFGYFNYMTMRTLVHIQFLLSTTVHKLCQRRAATIIRLTQIKICMKVYIYH